MDEAIRRQLVEVAHAVPQPPPTTDDVLIAGDRQRRRMWLAGAILSVAAVCLFLFLAYAGFYGRAAVYPSFNIPLVSQPTQVPRVTGVSPQVAKDRLERVGLKPKFSGPCRKTYTCWVHAQSPPADAQV